jgi:sRNA-binding carbon storage regulator CsrA
VGFIKMLVLTGKNQQSMVVGDEVESMVVDAGVYGECQAVSIKARV